MDRLRFLANLRRPLYERKIILSTGHVLPVLGRLRTERDLLFLNGERNKAVYAKVAYLNPNGLIVLEVLGIELYLTYLKLYSDSSRAACKDAMAGCQGAGARILCCPFDLLPGFTGPRTSRVHRGEPT